MKKLTLIFVVAIALFSCEAESFDQSIANQTETSPEETEDEPIEVIDTLIDDSKGLNN